VPQLRGQQQVVSASNPSTPSCALPCGVQPGYGFSMQDLCQQQHGCDQTDCDRADCHQHGCNGGPFGWYCCGDRNLRIKATRRNGTRKPCFTCYPKTGTGCYDWTCDVDRLESGGPTADVPQLRSAADVPQLRGQQQVVSASNLSTPTSCCKNGDDHTQCYIVEPPPADRPAGICRDKVDGSGAGCGVHGFNWHCCPASDVGIAWFLSGCH
jgi:hypothetical protein